MIDYEDITPGYYWARRTPHPNEDLIIYVHGTKPFYKMQLRMGSEVLDASELNNHVIFMARIPTFDQDCTIDNHGFISKLYPKE
jgi:hypothetical protein